ncbi:hypothetical protein LguiB_023918 [Lonicera macranthoides]
MVESSGSGIICHETSMDLEDDECISKNIQKCCLVGKIVAEKTISRVGVSNIIMASWKTKKSFSFSSWRPNVYVFNFEEEEDKQKVIKEGPWSFMGYVMILKSIVPEQNIEEMTFDKCAFWIQIHNLPFQKRSRQNIEKISSMVGTFIEIDEDTIANPTRGLFVRVKIEIDVREPLKRGFKMNRQNSDPLWIPFRYERLPIFCYGCGRIGHEKETCKFPKPDSTMELIYGPWMKAIQIKSSGFFRETRKEEILTTSSTQLTGDKQRPPEKSQAGHTDARDTMARGVIMEISLNEKGVVECNGPVVKDCAEPTSTESRSEKETMVAESRAREEHPIFKSRAYDKQMSISPFNSRKDIIKSPPLSQTGLEEKLSKPNSLPEELPDINHKKPPSPQYHQNNFTSPPSSNYFVTEPPDSPNGQDLTQPIHLNNLPTPLLPKPNNPTLLLSANEEIGENSVYPESSTPKSLILNEIRRATDVKMAHFFSNLSLKRKAIDECEEAREGKLLKGSEKIQNTNFFPVEKKITNSLEKNHLQNLVALGKENTRGRRLKCKKQVGRRVIGNLVDAPVFGIQADESRGIPNLSVPVDIIDNLVVSNSQKSSF